MCNNSPAESTSPENGWRSSVAPTPGRRGKSKGAAAASRRARRSRGGAACGVSAGGAASGADLGGSSKYSREDLEDRGGEGFRVNSSWTRVSRA